MSAQDLVETHSTVDTKTLLSNALQGGDIVRPSWLGKTGWVEKPNFDSAVIYGSGIGALTCAGRLARSQTFKGKVTIAGNYPESKTKLINGCTLRARSLEYFSAALGVAPKTILGALFGDRVDEAVTYRQEFGMFGANSSGEYHEVKRVPFMPEHADKRPYAFGVRNSHLAKTLASFLGESIDWKEPVSDIATLKTLASGDKPIVLNGNSKPPEDAPATDPPRRFIVAYQCKMRRKQGCALGLNTSMIAGFRAKRGIDIGVFYPFVDPLSPEADCYGLFYRIVDPVRGYSKEDEIAEMRAHVHGIGKLIGWTPIEEEESSAGAVVPGYSWKDVEAGSDGFCNLHRIFNVGIPIITGCGMARAGLGAWVCAEAILAGEDPSRAMNQSLGAWRKMNSRFAMGMDTMPTIANLLLTTIPSIVLPFAQLKNSWEPVDNWS